MRFFLACLKCSREKNKGDGGKGKLVKFRKIKNIEDLTKF